jgi:two-component system, NarL family, nitrate/nitrite response regulator NarP
MDDEREPGSADERSPASARRTIVYSDRAVIAQGLVRLLPEPWRRGARVVSDSTRPMQTETVPSGDAPAAAVVDLSASGAAEMAARIGEGGAILIVLVASSREAIDATAAEHADAILVRDEVTPETLRLAFEAAALGMRLLPRVLPSSIGGVARSGTTVESLGQPAQRAIELLADGMRDAEIARELHMSESAARKVIQRAVHRLGARTRSQAVAIGVREGALQAPGPPG